MFEEAAALTGAGDELRTQLAAERKRTAALEAAAAVVEKQLQLSADQARYAYYVRVQ